jgi:hypothetical protein
MTGAAELQLTEEDVAEIEGVNEQQPPLVNAA